MLKQQCYISHTVAVAAVGGGGKVGGVRGGSGSGDVEGRQWWWGWQWPWWWPRWWRWMWRSQGGVPFGHPRPPKLSTIILITLSDKVIVLKKKLLSIIFMLPPSHNNHHPASTLCNAPPSAYSLPLPPHVDCQVAPLPTPACRCQQCENAIALPTRHH